jgi:hypothetical protein
MPLAPLEVAVSTYRSFPQVTADSAFFQRFSGGGLVRLASSSDREAKTIPAPGYRNIRRAKPDEKNPNVQEPPKDDDEGDLPPNRDIKEPEKDPKISVQTNGKFADDFQDLNSV